MSGVGFVDVKGFGFTSLWSWFYGMVHVERWFGWFYVSISIDEAVKAQ